MKKEMLIDVVAIRLSLIFLLIVYHAMCIYTGAWQSPYNPHIDIKPYFYIGRFINSFQLEAMVFISGLLLGYAAMRKPDALSFRSCVVKKAKRILLPCLFFGVIYYVIFFDLHAPWYCILWKIVNGCGHLWFLPMLFWCFVITYVYSKLPPLSIYKISTWRVLVFLLLLSIANPIKIPSMGGREVFYYYLYFFTGYCIKTGKIQLLQFKQKTAIIAILIFLISFQSYLYIRATISLYNTLTSKVLVYILSNICRTASALSAIFLIYGFTNSKRMCAVLEKNPRLIVISGYCYGVYIYQQFILKLLYGYTQLPFIVDPYWLPWIATAVTVVLSLLLCYYSLKTRFGRFLIG